MTTQAQIEANRRNAQKSTGPKTPEGKLIASQNAATHGLTADRIVINNEDRDEFNALYAKMLIDLAPVGSLEQMLTERIIALTWRIKRSEWMESGVLNVLSNSGDVVTRVDKRQQRIPTPELCGLTDAMYTAIHSKNSRKYHAAVNKLAKLLSPNRDASPQTVLGCIAIEDFRESNVLERLLRYQGEIERSLYKALLELQKLQYIRKRNESIEVKAQSEKNETNPILQEQEDV